MPFSVKGFISSYEGATGNGFSAVAPCPFEPAAVIHAGFFRCFEDQRLFEIVPDLESFRLHG